MATHGHPCPARLTGTHRIARGAAPTDGFACGLLQVLRSSPRAEGLGTPPVLACGQEAWCANPPEARPRRPCCSRIARARNLAPIVVLASFVNRAVPCKAAPGEELSIFTKTQVRDPSSCLCPGVLVRVVLSRRSSDRAHHVHLRLGQSSSGGGLVPSHGPCCWEQALPTPPGCVAVPSRARIGVGAALARCGLA